MGKHEADRQCRLGTFVVVTTERFLTATAVLLLLATAGCVSVPPERISLAIDKQELSDHVHFLAQPRLRGRKAGSAQSKTVRAYLSERFTRYGLTPWPGEDQFSLDFGRGVNMLGVLRGDDPNLADQIVILAAHYDHIGRTEDGLCRGACDNASAVAVLLEIAEHLSLSKTPLKRSVCFAAFDAEERMAMGSFAFTLRDSFKNARVAAVINMDLLGRDFLDVVDDSLFVMGAEDYPELRTRIVQKGKELGLRMLPVAPEIAGPSGDHAAFQTLRMPVIFFSCGYYSDYHMPGDTPEKLDYTAIENAAHLVLQTVQTLANGDIGPFEPAGRYDPQLEALASVCLRMIAHYRDIGIDAQQAADLIELAAEAKRMAVDTESDPRAQRYLSLRIIRALKPAVKARCKVYKDARIMSAWEQITYADHQRFLLAGYRDLVQQLIANPPGLFSRIDFNRRTREIPEIDTAFRQTPDGSCDLDVLVAQLDFVLEKKGLLLPSVKFDLRGAWQPLYFGGTRAETIDYCLLQWRKHADECAWSASWAGILKTVSGEDRGGAYADWLDVADSDSRNETVWLTRLSQHDHAQLAAEATMALGVDAMCRLITNPNVPAGRRSLAIQLVDGPTGKEVDKALLLALAAVVKDDTLVLAGPKRYWPNTQDAHYPFAGHPACTKDQLQAFAVVTKVTTIRTVGQLAQQALRHLTQQNLGTDDDAWRLWVSTHVEETLQVEPPPPDFSTAELDKAHEPGSQ